MEATATEAPALDPADEKAIRHIPERMADAWNTGCGDAFAAVFRHDADFVAFEGTHLHGRTRIAEFHREAFATAVAGSRLEQEVRFVRAIAPNVAVVHAVARVTLAGGASPSPSRDSMQLFVVVRHDSAWRVAAVQNARTIPLERQRFLDDVEALAEHDRRRVIALASSAGRPA